MMLRDLVRQYSVIHIAGREYRVRYSLNAMLCLEMTYKPLSEILTQPYSQWTIDDVLQLVRAAMCCLPENYKAVNRRDFEHIRPTVAELGELIQPEDLPLLRLEIIAAVIAYMPVDVMHRPESEYWSSTNKEITERIDCYLEASGQKEAPVIAKRYGEMRQGEESI